MQNGFSPPRNTTNQMRDDIEPNWYHMLGAIALSLDYGIEIANCNLHGCQHCADGCVTSNLSNHVSLVNVNVGPTDLSKHTISSRQLTMIIANQ